MIIEYVYAIIMLLIILSPLLCFILICDISPAEKDMEIHRRIQESEERRLRELLEKEK